MEEMNRGRILQINASLGGVPKHPVPECVVTPLGIAGDKCAHPNIHGGPRQAILLIAREVIDRLAQAGYPLTYGSLGENLTVDGLDHRHWRAGQRYRVGNEVVIELTKPRGPCRTLDIYGENLKREIYDKKVKDGDPASPHWGMSGFYASVIQGGPVHPGAPILLLDQAV
jgi:MOSC domain-containing protein YiiM